MAEAVDHPNAWQPNPQDLADSAHHIATRPCGRRVQLRAIPAFPGIGRSCRAQKIVVDCSIELVHHKYVMSVASNKRKSFQFALDLHSGVPVYRQIIDQVVGGIATGTLVGGDQLPTIRQLAVDLSINPNTVIRAYRELEIRGVLETQQGTGTFVSHQKVTRDDAELQRRLSQLVGEFAARAGSQGFTTDELIERLQDLQTDARKKRR